MAFIPCPWCLCSMELKDWSWTLQRMNTPEYPGWGWAAGYLIPAPQTDLQQLRTSCNVLMASLHCSVLALNNWIGWRYSLNSQSYCGCHPVFIILNSSLIKSPTGGLGKINQHFRIYSCFHAVLSITSNIYFIVLLFSLNLITVQNRVLGERTPACIWIQAITRFESPGCCVGSVSVSLNGVLRGLWRQQSFGMP